MRIRRFRNRHLIPGAWFAGVWLGVVQTCLGASAQRAEVPILISGRTPVVEVRVNGNGPYRFLVDTGSLFPHIDVALAQELKLPLSMESSSAEDAGASEPSQYRIETLRVGDLELTDVVVKSWESHPLSPGGEPPHGILGLSLFEGSLITIDNPNRTLTIEPGALPPADGREVLDYERRDEAPTIEARVGGVELQLELHSGSFGPLQLRPEHQAKLDLRAPPARIGNISIDGVTGDVLGSRINGVLAFGKHELDRPSVYFCEAYPSDHLGSDALTSFAVTLDPANQRVRLRADHSVDELLSLRAADVPSLEENGASLREAFNRDSERIRLVIILSPT